MAFELELDTQLNDVVLKLNQNHLLKLNAPYYYNKLKFTSTKEKQSISLVTAS